MICHSRFIRNSEDVDTSPARTWKDVWPDGQGTLPPRRGARVTDAVPTDVPGSDRAEGDREEDEMTQSWTVPMPALVRVSVAEGRPGRVTITWTLDSEPTSEWIAVFDSVSTDPDIRNTVESAYGRPLVLRDLSIIWSVRDSEVRAAIAFVELAVTSANDRIEAERRLRAG
jgi:hypothetical protein